MSKQPQTKSDKINHVNANATVTDWTDIDKYVLGMKFGTVIN